MLNEIKPYFFYSQYNSIRMVECVEWNTYNKIKTVDNTLSYQEDGINDKGFYQLYQLNDALRNQFKSSYENHEITIKGCDGSTRTIQAMQRTNNLNIEDNRTAYKIEQNGVLVVYFGSGDTLDYSTNTVTGTYNLYQSLPSWMVAGKTINVDGFGEVTIERSIWLSEQGLYGLLINVDYTSATASITRVKSIYNKFEFNIFEFDLFFETFEAGKYQIEIKATDPNFEDTIYFSERLLLKETHEKTHCFIYSNSKNTQINYSYGIQHMMRLPYETELKYSADGENSTHKTDNNTYLLSATTYENYELELSPVPAGMAIKINMALALNQLFIDAKSYVSESKAEASKIGDSNLYDVKASVIVANNEYEDKSVGFVGTISGVTLLSDESGMIEGNEFIAF